MNDRRAVVFDGCFGWLHDGSARRGVVLCPAFGVEGLSALRAWGDLADRLAAAGLPTLRFDWPGTGDSLGDDRDPDRLPAWRAAAHAAVERLKAETGVEEVVLVGLRLGATVAAEVAAARSDVALFVAAAPVVSGRRFLREQKSFARLLRVRDEAGEPDADEIGGWAVAGFFTAAATAEALGAVDLLRAAPPAARVLMLAPEGDEAVAALAAKWREAGVQVEQFGFDGLETAIENPTRATVPEAAWARIVAAAGVGADAAPPRRPARPVAAPPRLDGGDWVETPLEFGPGRRLFGVLTSPKHPRAGAPTVILFDAGRIPHVGWGRGAVETARELAAGGRRVLRMDTAGIGDSRAHPDGPEEVLYSRDQIEDARAAMDRLAADGAERFVLVGTCSGAHVAFHAALADPRVVGLGMLNLQRFVWRPGDSLEVAMRNQLPAGSVYRRRLLRTDTWKRLFTGRIAVLTIAAELGRRWKARLAARIRRVFFTDPVRADLRRLAARGAGVLFVFGTEDGGRDEFAAHVGKEEAVGRAVPGAVLHLVADTDHNFSPRDARLRVREHLVAFLDGIESRAPSTATGLAPALVHLGSTLGSVVGATLA
ncbi:MAG: alpha/beta fold hydrolase [Phyllobacteriaceae bacterium]|nr:alpha/beta fold hydrolase [Phyllobacteriaceae bacterium]